MLIQLTFINVKWPFGLEMRFTEEHRMTQVRVRNSTVVSFRHNVPYIPTHLHTLRYQHNDCLEEIGLVMKTATGNV